MTALNMWGLTDKQKVGQLLMLGFSGTHPSPDIKRLMAEFGLGGVVLFGHNIENPLQVAQLCRQLQELAVNSPPGVPLFIAVDQEGGRVTRLTEGFTPLPPMATLGVAASPRLARSFGQLVGRELRWLGINMNLAPVLDINSQPRNPVIGDRSLSDDPTVVAQLGWQIVNGLNRQGVLAVGKHFPGHGDTKIDSHFSLPVVDQNRQTLEQRELVPFKTAIANGLEALMSAHVLYPALDEEYPATLSADILTGLLRRELGFKGMIISDDLLMKALDQTRLPQIAVRAVLAGVDLLLVGREDAPIDEIIDALLQAVKRGIIPPERLEQAVGNILRLKRRWLAPAPMPAYEQLKNLGGEAHRQVIQAIYQQAGVTV
jgi:beta-N-acetylhexosaminidase